MLMFMPIFICFLNKGGFYFNWYLLFVSNVVHPDPKYLKLWTNFLFEHQQILSQKCSFCSLQTVFILHQTDFCNCMKSPNGTDRVWEFSPDILYICVSRLRWYNTSSSDVWFQYFPLHIDSKYGSVCTHEKVAHSRC